MVEILEKLGLEKPSKFTTEELKKIYLSKEGEKTPVGWIATKETVELLRKIPDQKESRIRKYVESAFKECIEDIRYNNDIVSTRCISKKISDEKFRDRVRRPERYIPGEAVLKFPKK